ncbi:MAG: ABC transporter permease [Microcystaceae cyanobacterium]
MLDSFYLAWQYLKFNKLKTIIIIACVTVVGSLPINLNLFLAESEKQLMMRANSTPLIIGAKGSDLDLTINTLYFTSQPPERIKMADVSQINNTKLAHPIPIYSQFKARNYPIIGTNLDYFSFRRLSLKEGRYFSILGECVLGASIAQKLNLQVGDTIVSSPENLFDLGGTYPLKMKVVGILDSSKTADDLAIFTDLKTTWIIEGLGHGHLDLVESGTPDVILKQDQQNISANAKLKEYNEITNENLTSFHFHGEQDNFPLTGIIAIPKNQKAEALLRGEYQVETSIHQIIKPTNTIQELLLEVFKIRNLLNVVFVIVILATAITIFLVFNLSLKLRQREMETNFSLGCSRATNTKLIISEIVIIILISSSLTLGITVSLKNLNTQIIRALIL